MERVRRALVKAEECVRCLVHITECIRGCTSAEQDRAHMSALDASIAVDGPCLPCRQFGDTTLVLGT
jgi:hypothetical protein